MPPTGINEPRRCLPGEKQQQENKGVPLGGRISGLDRGMELHKQTKLLRNPGIATFYMSAA